MARVVGAKVEKDQHHPHPRNLLQVISTWGRPMAVPYLVVKGLELGGALWYFEATLHTVEVIKPQYWTR